MSAAGRAPAVIVGGGIGGLTAAIALRRAGIDVRVFEQAAAFQPVGAGLHLWCNALLALRQLDMADAVADVGVPIEQSQCVTWRGELLGDWPVGVYSRALGVPTVGVTRADLHAVLLAALDPEVLTLGARCTGFTPDDSGVTVRFAGGCQERGALLIGADGIRSAVREQLGSAPQRYAGYTAWRALLPFDEDLAPPGLFRIHLGPGARFLFYRVRPDVLYWLALARAPEGGADVEGQRRAALLQRYRGFAAPVEAIIDATPESAILRTDIHDRRPSRHWGDGRVTLLGDAAHAMTPNSAQGACQAIEDAVALAKHVAGVSDGVVSALRSYEATRRRRTARLVRKSRILGSISQWANPYACALRDPVLRVMFRTVAWQQQRQEMSYQV